jgi:hypothetical protein
MTDVCIWRIATFAAVQHYVGYPAEDRTRQGHAKIDANDPKRASG